MNSGFFSPVLKHRLEEKKESLVNALAKIDFGVNSDLFVKSGFIARGSSTPSARNQEIVAAIRAVTEKMKDGTGEEKKPKITKPPLRTVH